MSPDPVYPMRFSTHRFSEADGFSLTELLIVVVIIGILALLAIPRFMSVATRAKQTEAKLALRTLHTLQQSHLYEYDRYAADPAELGFEQEPTVDDGGTSRYRVRIEEADGSHYLAVAQAIVDFDDDGTFDEWTVDQSGQVNNRTPD